MNKPNNGSAGIKESNLNTIKLIGTVAGEAAFSHSIARKVDNNNVNIAFCRFTLEIPRLSGVPDSLEVIIPEDTWRDTFNGKGYVPGDDSPKAVVEINGRIQSRSHTDADTGKNKLDLFVYAKSIRHMNKDSAAVPDYEYLNTVSLEGYICKPPTIRQTPLGRTVADLFIAVNRRRGSAYVPVILWGGNAINAKDFNVGDKVRLDGRFQSRQFLKTENGEAVTHMAYELSASKVRTLKII